MKQIIKEVLEDIFGSNRLWHLGLMIIPSFVSVLVTKTVICGIIVSIATASSLELKDVLWSSKCKFSIKTINQLNWKNWDWLDWLFTMIGGYNGAMIYLLIFGR